MLVTKYVEELGALSNNGTQLQLWEHEWEKERKRGSFSWKGFVQEKKTNPIEKIEVWRFLLDNNSKF